MTRVYSIEEATYSKSEAQAIKWSTDGGDRSEEVCAILGADAKRLDESLQLQDRRFYIFFETPSQKVKLHAVAVSMSEKTYANLQRGHNRYGVNE